MKYVPLYDHEIKWLLRHVNFQNNIKLYQRLVSHVRQEECLVSNKAYIVNTINEDQPQILETYDLFDDPADPASTRSQAPLLGFHTNEQYFTDPKNKRIYFSEKGFIFYTDGKAIFLISRENGKAEKTGYDHVKSGESVLDIRKEVPFLKIHDEYFWPITSEEEHYLKEIEEARSRLGAKPEEEVCPKCKTSILVLDDTQHGNRNFYCTGCEVNLRKEPHGWIIK